MANMKIKSISEIAEIISGGTPKTSNPEFWGGSIPWISIADFNNNLKYVKKTEKYITQKGLKNSSTNILNKNDIIISARGTVGALAQLSCPMAFNQSCYGIRAKEKTINDFLFYSIKNIVDTIKANTHGSVFDTITRETFNNLKISLPPLPEQKAIADTLSCLDDKIELNNEINKNLEEQAQALFKRWFVDFNFPDENGDPYKDSGGEMVESELGLIPKGWSVEALGACCTCVLGGTPSREKAEYWDGNISWINSGAVNNFRIIEASEYITELGLRNSATKLMPKKTVVIAITGATLGQMSLFEIDSCANQSVVGILENDRLPYVFIYPLIKSIINEIANNSTGGAQQHINKGNIESQNIVVPCNDIIVYYKDLVSNLYNAISNNCFEVKKLVQLRNLILPKLMRGKIRIPLEDIYE